MDTLLLIDDDADLLNTTSRILSLSNYNVITAQNGSIALELMKKNTRNISLILCDITMPELDGHSIFRACKNSSELSGIPFVFMSANFERNDIRNAMDLGADDYLTKPFTSNEILSLISARIRKSQVNKEKKNAAALKLGNVLFDKGSFNNDLVFTNSLYIKKANKKEVLYSEGDPARYMYYIIKGKVKQFKTTEFGKEYITNIHSEGDFFGNYTLTDPSRHLDTAVVLENSEIGLLSKYEFINILLNNSEICIKYLNHISMLLHRAEDRLPKLAYHSARKRVADALLLVVKKYNSSGSDKCCLPVSRDDLSAISGIAAESVSRNLTDFKNEGLIESNNGKLIITDYKKLENIKN